LDFIGGKYKDENNQEQDTRLFEGDNEIAFDHVNFREAKRVRFEHVDLSRASFLMSQIENIDFINVRWNGPERYKIYDERKWRERRVKSEIEEKGEVNQSSADSPTSAAPSEDAVGAGLKPAPTPAADENAGRYPNLPYKVWTVGRDWIRAWVKSISEEFRLLRRTDKDELKEIENLYHQLILNYDRRRDYETGGEFYVRENEVRRIRKGWRGYFFEGIYWLTSEYGQRWFLPLLWTTLALITFSPIFSPNDKFYQGPMGWGLNWLSEITWPAFSSNVAVLLGIQRLADAIKPTSWDLFLISVERILIFYLISMFLLAVRRRFRR